MTIKRHDTHVPAPAFCCLLCESKLFRTFLPLYHCSSLQMMLFSPNNGWSFHIWGGFRHWVLMGGIHCKWRVCMGQVYMKFAAVLDRFGLGANMGEVEANMAAKLSPGATAFDFTRHSAGQVSQYSSGGQNQTRTDCTNCKYKSLLQSSAQIAMQKQTNHTSTIINVFNWIQTQVSSEDDDAGR